MMGGKPKPGGKPDRRLAANKPKPAPKKAMPFGKPAPKRPRGK